DGYEYVFTNDNYWRKNRHDFGDGVGVDLNRNYPFGWDAVCGGSSTVTSQTYRGPAAASEPETQAMIAFGRNRRFVKVADLHSYARQVRYGNGCLPHPFMSFLASEAGDLAAAAGYREALSCCTGGDIHFHMANHGSHAFLWEVHNSFQPDFASARSEAARVFPSLLALLQRPVCLSGHVTDAFTGAAVAAKITYLDVTFENGETNSSDEQWGRYHAFMPQGTYTLEFAANGYFPQYRTVKVVPGMGQVVDVTMISSAGDINGDNRVDIADFAALAMCWHRGGNSACSGADLTNDQNVDFSDFKILADTWLQSSDSGYTTEASGLSITSLWHGREVTVPANR
ncbi:MAG: M14 family zinc carboxypeptidase, partial [Planctomycetota bacterium]